MCPCTSILLRWFRYNPWISISIKIAPDFFEAMDFLDEQAKRVTLTETIFVCGVTTIMITSFNRSNKILRAKILVEFVNEKNHIKNVFQCRLF